MIRQILRGGREADDTGAPPLASVSHPPIRWLDPPPGPWSVERSYAYCEEFARAHTESYPVASRFVPPELRQHLVALYAFARSADDFADEPEYEGRRAEAIDRWEEALHRCSHGEADHPVFVALADTIEKRDLSIPPLHDMLTAFRMDLEVRRYATFQALRGYTVRSADPVGRLLLALFGYRDPALVRYADEMSTALQLTNFWQDVAADAARDHIYIPAEDLHHFCVSEADIKALKLTPALRDLLRFEVTRTRALYERGRPLLEKVGKDLRMELTLIWLVGTTILDKIEAAGYDVFAHRPSIRRRDQAVIMARAAKEWATHLDLGALRALWP